MVQINNYMSGTSKVKESPNALHSKTGLKSGSLVQKNVPNRNTQVSDVISKTGFRNMSNLRTYNDGQMDIDQSGKLLAISFSNKSGAKRNAPKWKATFTNLNNQFS